MVCLNALLVLTTKSLISCYASSDRHAVVSDTLITTEVPFRIQLQCDAKVASWLLKLSRSPLASPTVVPKLNREFLGPCELKPLSRRQPFAEALLLDCIRTCFSQTTAIGSPLTDTGNMRWCMEPSGNLAFATRFLPCFHFLKIKTFAPAGFLDRRHRSGAQLQHRPMAFLSNFQAGNGFLESFPSAAFASSWVFDGWPTTVLNARTYQPARRGCPGSGCFSISIQFPPTSSGHAEWPPPSADDSPIRPTR
jgi:hypothetical protein